MKEQHSWPLPFAESPILDLDAGALALEIVPVDQGDPSRLEALSGFSDDQTAPQIALEDGTVKVRFGQSNLGWPPWGRGRHNRFRLWVPPNVRARVRCAAGQLRAQKLSGCDLELSTGAGQIALRDVHGRLTLEASAGEIRGERIGGTLHIESSLGSVRLAVDALDPGTHRVHSSMGSVRLELVEGLKVRIDAQTTMGSTRNRYPSTPDADIILALETDLGSVRIDPGGSRRGGRDAPREDWRSAWGGEGPWQNLADLGGHLGRHSDRFARMAHHRHGFGHRGGHWFQDPFGDSPEPPGAPPAPAAPVASAEEVKRILTLVEQGKINAEQASTLIQALHGR